MTIEVQMIEDSISRETGIRLSTLQLRYPRFIHSEFMTHRDFSRNASSSRAIPIQKSIRDVIEDPAMPEEWGQNQKGMQAGAPLSGFWLWLVRTVWLLARWPAVAAAWVMMKAGAHKQIVNRILEPWSHISVVVTSSHWENFLGLRLHEAADPTIRVLAYEIDLRLFWSTPRPLQPGEWHLPYISEEERVEYGPDLLRVLSAARCARVSYLKHEGGKPSHADDFALWEKLVESKPVHASPTEHQATPDVLWGNGRWKQPKLHGNFHGWVQHRKLIPGEVIR